jgi:hypothetical protein
LAKHAAWLGSIVCVSVCGCCLVLVRQLEGTLLQLFLYLQPVFAGRWTARCSAAEGSQTISSGPVSVGKRNLREMVA